MTDRPHCDTELAKLAAQTDLNPLASELVARLHEGRTAEVAALIAQIAPAQLNRLSYISYDHQPWQQDPASWFTLAGLTVPRGVLLTPGYQMHNARNPDWAAAFEQMARTLWAGVASGDDAARQQTALFILTELLSWTSYPGMPAEHALELLHWAVQLRLDSGLGLSFHHRCGWHGLLDSLSDEQLLQMAEIGGELYLDCMSTHCARHRQIALPQRWQSWHDFFRRHPDYYDNSHVQDDPGLALLRLEIREPAAPSPARLISEMYHLLRHADLAYTRELLQRALQQDAQLVLDTLQRLHWCMSPTIARAIWEARFPELLPSLVASVLQLSPASAVPLLTEIFSAEPERVQEATPGRLAAVLEQLPAELLPRLLPHFAPLLAGSTSRSLRQALARALRTFSPQDIATTGWLTQRSKNLQLACRDILLAHPDPAIAPLLLQLHQAELDLGSTSQIEARLAELGVTAPGAVDTSGMSRLQALEARIAGFKRFSAAIRPLDEQHLLALFAPLSAHAARILLHLAATCEEELPPLVHQLLDEIEPAARARLCHSLLQHWVASDGEPKQRWVLRLLEGNGDDQLVATLAEAVSAWGKARPPRAIIAVEQLGALDSLYALARLQALRDSRKLGNQVRNAIDATLLAAAERRNLTLADLCDELTPDFGLGNGLQLQVGEHSWEVLLQGDLSLRLRGSNGKLVKTLPAVKDAALQAAHAEATAQLKTISTGLKAIAREQGPRLQAAFLAGRSWEAARWQRLFLQHPLLRILGRSLIWLIEDSGESFRIAEDFSLVTVDDDAIELPEACRIRLWHPCDADAQQIAGWQQYLADYELQPLFEQTGAPATLPDASRWQDGLLRVPSPVHTTQSRLYGQMAKWKYRAGPVEDGPGIYCHLLDLSAGQLRVELRHSACLPYMELEHPVEIEGACLLDLRQPKPQPLAAEHWPRPLLALLNAQLATLAGAD